MGLVVIAAVVQYRHPVGLLHHRIGMQHFVLQSFGQRQLARRQHGLVERGECAGGAVEF